MFGTREELTDLFNFNTSNNKFCCILQISNKCNIRCSCCYNEFLRNLSNADEILRPEVLEKIIKTCVERDIPMYTGVGEPFAWWEYTRDILIPMLNKYNSKYIISTNGLWGNDKQIIQEALTSNIKNMFISHDWWHNQSVPVEYINNILEAFKDSSTKVYIASIWNKAHPKGEYTYKYHDQIEFIWYDYGNQVNGNTILSHDREGNVKDYNLRGLV